MSLAMQKGITALSMASIMGHFQVVNRLLEKGAKPDLQDEVLD